MKTLVTIAALVLTSSTANAHFIWLSPVENQPGKTTLEVYFGEDAYPDDPSLLSRLKGMELHKVSHQKEPETLELSLTEKSLSAPIASLDEDVLYIASHDLGVFDRGGKTFRLKYYAKGGPSITNQTWQSTNCREELVLDMVPSYADGEVTVVVTFNGKLIAGADVYASGPDLEDFEGTTDDAGKVSFRIADPGRYSIRARHIELTPGELNGKTYPETRHYTTVAVEVPAPAVPHKNIATVPREVTSFGAAILNDHVYMYGGHTGGAHSYSTAEQSNSLSSLNLKTGDWNELATGPRLQGLAMVAYAGKLFRIGGFTAMNAEGEDHDLHSQTAVAQFDPATKEWKQLPPLPEPRSSHDAAVLGHTIYVVGGWSLHGETDSTWHSTAWKLDLGKEMLKWEEMPAPPFQRRALSLAAHQNRLYVIGGMQSDGGPTRRVDVFDPATQKWTTGPELNGSKGLTGFGTSAFDTGGQLYVSTIDGTLQRLAADGSKWETCGRTPTARFFHRMLPVDDEHLLILGGANMSIGKFDEVEVISVKN